MSGFVPFLCTNCGGIVKLSTASGNTREYKHGLRVSIPDNFAMPICEHCKEYYLNLSESEALDLICEQKINKFFKESIDNLVEKKYMSKKMIAKSLCLSLPEFIEYYHGLIPLTGPVIRLLQLLNDPGSRDIVVSDNFCIY